MISGCERDTAARQWEVTHDTLRTTGHPPQTAVQVYPINEPEAEKTSRGRQRPKSHRSARVETLCSLWRFCRPPYHEDPHQKQRRRITRAATRGEDTRVREQTTAWGNRRCQTHTHTYLFGQAREDETKSSGAEKERRKGGTKTSRHDEEDEKTNKKSHLCWDLLPEVRLLHFRDGNPRDRRRHAGPAFEPCRPPLGRIPPGIGSSDGIYEISADLVGGLEAEQVEAPGCEVVCRAGVAVRAAFW